MPFMGGATSMGQLPPNTDTQFGGPPAPTDTGTQALPAAPATPPVKTIKATLERLIDGSNSLEESHAKAQAYLQSIGLDNRLWDAIRTSGKDDGQIDPNTDTTTGAPAQWAAALASVPNRAQQLTMLRNNFAPDARPFGSSNFIYTDPQTGKPTLFKPANRELGVTMPSVNGMIASIPDFAHGLGMALGGAAGSAVSSPAAAGGPLGLPIMAAASAGGAGIGSAMLGGPIDALLRQLGGVPGPGAGQDVKNEVDEAGTASAMDFGGRALGGTLSALGKKMGIVKYDPAATTQDAGAVLDAAQSARVPLTLGQSSGASSRRRSRPSRIAAALARRSTLQRSPTPHPRPTRSSRSGTGSPSRSRPTTTRSRYMAGPRR